MTASIMRSDSTPLEHQATRLLTVSNTDITQHEFLLKNAVFLWSDPETRLLQNKLWNFYINTALNNYPNRKQKILDDTLVKLAELYMKDRNPFMFNAVYTAMQDLIGLGSEISRRLVEHVSHIRANDDDFPLRQLVFRYVAQFASRFFLLSLCAIREESPMSMLPAEIIFMIARNSICYAAEVSTTAQKENRKLEREIRSDYPEYWSARRAPSNVEMRQRTNAEEAAVPWLKSQIWKK